MCNIALVYMIGKLLLEFSVDIDFPNHHTAKNGPFRHWLDDLYWHPTPCDAPSANVGFGAGSCVGLLIGQPSSLSQVVQMIRKLNVHYNRNLILLITSGSEN